MDELTELKQATEVKTVADSAVQTQEEQSVAHAINTAANTGQHCITWSKSLSKETITLLESKGYQVVPNDRAADPSYSWTIRGF